ncbi:hypothetical protein M9458_053064, partial [Cirrhinus mrigala]
MSGVNDDHYVIITSSNTTPQIAQSEIFDITYIPALASKQGKLLDCDSWSK